MKTTDKHHLPIENLEDVRGYATSDIFERHPTKDYLWKMYVVLNMVLYHRRYSPSVLRSPVELVAWTTSLSTLPERKLCQGRWKILL